MAVCMLAVALVGLETPTLPGDSKSEPVGIAIVFLLFFFILFYKPSWVATVWIWTSEVFSMNVRAQAVGMASQTQNVANSILQQFFPTFLANCGFVCYQSPIPQSAFHSNLKRRKPSSSSFPSISAWRSLFGFVFLKQRKYPSKKSISSSAAPTMSRRGLIFSTLSMLIMLT